MRGHVPGVASSTSSQEKRSDSPVTGDLGAGVSGRGGMVWEGPQAQSRHLACLLGKTEGSSVLGRVGPQWARRCRQGVCGSGSQCRMGLRTGAGGHLVLPCSWTWGRRPDASSQGADGSFPTCSEPTAQRGPAGFSGMWLEARRCGPGRKLPQAISFRFSLGLGVSSFSSFHRSLFYRSSRMDLRMT